MNTSLWARAAATGLVALGLVAAPTTAAVAGPDPTRSSGATQFAEPDAQAADHHGPIAEADRVDLVAVTGTNRRLYVRLSDGPAWLDLGGQLKDAPAIAQGIDDDYFVGLGMDDNVWVRTVGLPWKRLAPVGSRCTGPTARTSHDLFTVACRGTNGRLYAGTTTLRPGELPLISGWRDLGGQVKHGVALSDLGDETTPRFSYAAVGMDDLTWLRTDAPGWSQWPSGWRCAAAFETSEYLESWACRDASSGGLLAQNSMRMTREVLPGRVVGRPGVAVDPDYRSRFYVLGTDGNVYVARQRADGAIERFVRFGGAGIGGVVAVSLT